MQKSSEGIVKWIGKVFRRSENVFDTFIVHDTTKVLPSLFARLWNIDEKSFNYWKIYDEDR